MGSGNRGFAELLSLSDWPVHWISPCVSFVSSVEHLSLSMRQTTLKYNTIYVVSFMLETPRKRARTKDFLVVAKLILTPTDCDIGSDGWGIRPGK
jgi:hypothetical protein